MPISIESSPILRTALALRERRLKRGSVRDRGRRLRIGLVNNMPDAALHATERQFMNLIEEASGEYDIRVTLVALESLPRDAEVRKAIAATYRGPRQLRLASPDALIFTGAEPRATQLTDEPFWDELTALFDWSRGGVESALYSCLAAHAAVLHRDGIQRRRLLRKLSGVFESDVVMPHELTEGLSHTIAPHSRLNALAECDLEFKGYLTLTRSDEAGPDVFVREREMLEVFWHGHPEYDRDTLAREFRRDAARYLHGERPVAPNLPAHYFDRDARLAIEAALAGDTREVIAAIESRLDPEMLSPPIALWRETAIKLTSNWLSAIARRKALRIPVNSARRRWGG